MIAFNDLNLEDVIVVDVSKPQSPKEVWRTGISDWRDDAYPEIADDAQLFTGVFAAPLLHDVWVAKGNGHAAVIGGDGGAPSEHQRLPLSHLRQRPGLGRFRSFRRTRRPPPYPLGRS